MYASLRRLLHGLLARDAFASATAYPLKKVKPHFTTVDKTAPCFWPHSRTPPQNASVVASELFGHTRAQLRTKTKFHFPLAISSPSPPAFNSPQDQLQHQECWAIFLHERFPPHTPTLAVAIIIAAPPSHKHMRRANRVFTTTTSTGRVQLTHHRHPLTRLLCSLPATMHSAGFQPSQGCINPRMTPLMIV